MRLRSCRTCAQQQSGSKRGGSACVFRYFSPPSWIEVNPAYRGARAKRLEQRCSLAKLEGARCLGQLRRVGLVHATLRNLAREAHL